MKAQGYNENGLRSMETQDEEETKMADSVEMSEIVPKKKAVGGSSFEFIDSSISL